MGFFDKLTGDAVMSDSAFFFMDDDAKKLRICQDAGQRMAPAIGGSVKVRDGGDEVHVTGQFGQYSVRIIIWVTFANFRVQVKSLRKLSVPFGGLSLKYDDEAAKHASEQLDRDEWDSDQEQKLYLSKCVYMEGDREELAQSKFLFDQLPRELTTPLIQWLESSQKSGPWFTVRDDMLELYLNDSNITLSKTSAQKLYGLLQLLTAILSTAEQNWPRNNASDPFAAMEAAEAARAAALGPPMGPPPVAASFAPGTPVLVTWGDGNRYPATVLSSAPGQYLCAFPNGQQQWVGAPFVGVA